MPHSPANTPLPAVTTPGGPPASQQNGLDRQQEDDANGEAGFSVPALQFQVRDLKHIGAKRFLGAVNTTDCMTIGTINVLRLLYNTPSDRETTAPPTSSVTLVLEDMPGVAYTIGSHKDDNIKEIHFSLQYIAGIAASRTTHEITGVITHELVHCFQYNGLGAAPGGLIEGIADWVRLHCDLAPPHWKQETPGNWDAGYQHTAYFLDYLEKRFGSGTVRRINEKLRTSKYHEGVFWIELFGREVNQLYEEYVESFGENSKA